MGLKMVKSRFSSRGEISESRRKGLGQVGASPVRNFASNGVSKRKVKVMTEKEILIIDDEPNIRWVLSKVLSEEGYRPSIAKDGEEALSKIAESRPDLVILDMRLPKMDGIEVLKRIRKTYEKLLVIILTGYQSVTNAVEAMKLGAWDYLTKPVDKEKIKITIKNALETQWLIEKVTNLQEQLKERFKFDNIIGNSPQMQKVYDLVRRVANYNVTVLLVGESGTGKELIAHAIHYNSNRTDKPFISIDCATLPETLVESEIFGYEKGAFTGADAKKLGKFELANGGTLFLDEIGNLSTGVQVKLLRVLQERKIERLGGKEPIRIDVRIITATNMNLERAVKKGEFRDDLYHRLNVFSIYLPPLREREGDMLLLVKHFLEKFNQEHHKDIKNFSPEAMEALIRYYWPGNVRELKNAIERAILLADDTILLEHLPLSIQTATDKPEMGAGLRLEGGHSLKDVGKIAAQKVERELIIKTLNQENWNKVRVAQILSIDYKTLYNKLKEYGIKREA